MRAFHGLIIAAIASAAVSPALAAVTCEDMTGLQVAAGFVTWMNVLRVFAIVVGAACLGFLLLRFFRHVPAQAYLGLGYVASAALMMSGAYVAPENQLWPVLGGCLLFGIVHWITGVVSGTKADPEAFFGVLVSIWGPVAVFYHENIVGFIAVGAFMGLLGFSAAVVPMGYLLGFRDSKALSRATAAGFAVLAIYVAVRALGYQNQYLSVFEPGALWFGSFVGYLGLLISSSRWHDGGLPYALRQGITAVAGMAALAFGSLLAIPELLGIGGTFFALYLIEKPFDVPVKRMTGYAVTGLCVSAAVGGAVFWAQNHMDVVGPYLLF